MKNLDLVLIMVEFFFHSVNFSFQSSATIVSRAPIFGVPARHASTVQESLLKTLRVGLKGVEQTTK